MINRREFLGITAGAGASLALTADLIRAFQQSSGKLMQRPIPSSGEMLPVVGLQFGNRPAQDPAALKEVLKALLDRGGRLLDTVHQSAVAEEGSSTIATDLGVQDRVFWSSPATAYGPSKPGAAAPAKPEMEKSVARFKVARLDLAMVGALTAHLPANVAVLRELKKEGRVRYIGVHDLLDPPGRPQVAIARLESAMRNEAVDFVATDYHVGDRRVEEKLLPLAQERKIAFMAYFTFDRGRLFKRVGNTPLPEWAAEFDARTWAQFFLKYVLSHPAVTVARTGTTQAAHMLDNIGGGIGRLPNEAMRKRMAELVDSWPGSQETASPSSEGAERPETRRGGGAPRN